MTTAKKTATATKVATKTTEPTILTTKRAINAAIKKLTDDQCVTVKFKPITDKVWLDDGRVEDNDGDAIEPGILGQIVAGKSADFTCSEPYGYDGADVRLYADDNSDESVVVDARHIAELTVGKAPPAPVTVSGMSITMTFKESEIEVYGQTIRKAGALIALKSIAEKLGAKLTPSSKTISLVTAKSAEPAAAVTTRAAINAAMEKLRTSGAIDNTRILVKFKPLTDKVWRNTDGALVPAADNFYGRHLARLVDNETLVFTSVRYSWNNARFGNSEGTLNVTADHVLELTMPTVKSTTPPQVEGLSYNMTWANDNGLKVGCQNINSTGVMQLLDLLAKFCGYTVKDIAGIAAANKISFSTASLLTT